jgi:hypothetical protein
VDKQTNRALGGVRARVTIDQGDHSPDQDKSITWRIRMNFWIDEMVSILEDDPPRSACANWQAKSKIVEYQDRVRKCLRDAIAILSAEFKYG